MGLDGVGVADMITMDHLTEEVLLSNLELRFKKNIIYVCTLSSYMRYLAKIILFV
jgi:myosin heavy subunit